MSPRLKRIVNYTEQRVLDILDKSVDAQSARVLTKPRVADVLEIRQSGLSAEEYSYTLRAHFDFVVADTNFMGLFAVEFDGPIHVEDVEARRRDTLKQSICDRFSFPLLRIGSQFIDSEVRRFSLLSWLVQVWFLQRDFDAQQSAGAIPLDEPFEYKAILAHQGEIESGIGTTFPYDLSWPSRISLMRQWKRGTCINHVPSVCLSVSPDWRRASSIALMQMNLGDFIIGHANCSLAPFGPVTASELCSDLSIIDVATKVEQFIDGNHGASNLLTTRATVTAFLVRSAKNGDKLIFLGRSLDGLELT